MHRIISFFSLLILVCCTGAQPQSTTASCVEIQKPEPITATSASLPARVDLNTYLVTVDYSMLPVDMINAGRYDKVRRNNPQDSFPMYKAGWQWTHRESSSVSVELHLIPFDHKILTEEVLVRLDERRLRSATLPELLAFGAAFPELQLKFNIRTLWRDQDGTILAPYLYERRGKRELSLNRYGLQFPWGTDNRFLAVSK